MLFLFVGISDRHITLEERSQWLAAGTTVDADQCSCCYEMQNESWPEDQEVGAGVKWRRSYTRRYLKATGNGCVSALRCIRRWTRKLVDHKYFQQGILFAILINTLSMGIEYHNQVRLVKPSCS